MDTLRHTQSTVGDGQIRVEVITIGDEIISGTIVDTNSALIAQKLLGLGLEVWRMASIGDDPQGIQETLKAVAGRSQFGIVTGGLGPTEDDRTALAAADAFARPLVLHEPSLRWIRQIFEDRGFEMTPNNERQAWIPEGAMAIPNPIGTAPGFALDVDNSLLAFFPGVPRELERMLDETLVPLAAERFQGRICVSSRTLKVFGLTEAKMDHMIRGLLSDIPGVSLASLPRYPENRLRITARAESSQEVVARLQEAEARLKSRLGESIYGVDDQELESVLKDLLLKERMTLALAESCTGGLVAHRLTNVPGCSEVLERGFVTYSAQAKEDLLGVPREILVNHGVVSAAAAEAMACGARKNAGSALGLSVTGIAGPTGGSEETPVGTVFMGLADARGTWSRHFRFRGGRTNIKTLAATVALDWLRRYLLGEDPSTYPTPWR